MSIGGADLHPLVDKVAGRQLRSLRVIYAVLGGLILAILVVTGLLGDPFGGQSPAELGWIEIALAGLSLALIGLVLPLTRWRLLGTRKVRQADGPDLAAAGLPEGVDLRIGRQALYLTRYTAGCVIGWGLCVAVALYGLVARMLGAGAIETGLFFAAAVFVLVLLPPDRRRLFAALRALGH